eukprot:4354190-Pleurochrysis_carterae.AAC.2
MGPWVGVVVVGRRRDVLLRCVCVALRARLWVEPPLLGEGEAPDARVVEHARRRRRARLAAHRSALSTMHIQ